MSQVEPIKPEEFRAMAVAINKVAEASKQMLASGLTNEALVILLHHRTRVAQMHIREILGALPALADLYLTPEYRKLVKEQK